MNGEERDLTRLFRRLRGLRVEIAGMQLRVPNEATPEQADFLRLFIEAQAKAVGALPAGAMLPAMQQLMVVRIPVVLAAVLTPGGRPWSPEIAKLVALRLSEVSGKSKFDLQAIADRVVREADLRPFKPDADCKLAAPQGFVALIELSAALGRGESGGRILYPKPRGA